MMTANFCRIFSSMAMPILYLFICKYQIKELNIVKFVSKAYPDQLSIYLIHLMKKLSGVMPNKDLFYGFPTSNLMCNYQLLEMNSRSLNISNSHETSL